MKEKARRQSLRSEEGLQAKVVLQDCREGLEQIVQHQFTTALHCTGLTV